MLHSDYMRFAKLDTGARFGLASSGVADCTMADLRPNLDSLALHGPNSYGYGPLVQGIAARFAISPAEVVTAGGASFANHLVMAAVLSPGDEVLIEDPTYELLRSTLGYFQADLRTFERRPQAGWALEAGAVIEKITPRTRLVVLTNLHNPTGALADPATVEAIAAAADRVGALVMIDEVYLELMFRSGETRTAFRAEGNVVVTSSLTKAYGLSGLRCGWILAREDLAERMRRLNDLFASLPPHMAECLSVTALERLPELRVRANRMIEANRRAYAEILGAHSRLNQTILDQGTTVFPCVLGADGDELFELLMSRFETSVVPGRFFGRPDHVRIGLAGDTVMTRAGLERISQALDLL
jgi:aspartate/methionine/tyrosine aminotransferase